MLRFAGEPWSVDALACPPVAACAAWFAAPAIAAIVCETAPLSPGLSMRTEIATFAAPPWVVAAEVGAAAPAVGSTADAAGPTTVVSGTVGATGAAMSSACAGMAKPSASAVTARPVPPVRRTTGLMRPPPPVSLVSEIPIEQSVDARFRK